MATFDKILLSGSTDGRPIKVGAVATPGTLLHTAISGSVNFDELWIYATNTSGVTRQLTIEFGGVTSPDDLIEVDIPGQSGLVLVIPGSPLNNAAVVRAFAAAADVINVLGYANRITS